MWFDRASRCRDLTEKAFEQAFKSLESLNLAAAEINDAEVQKAFQVTIQMFEEMRVEFLALLDATCKTLVH
jgi:hypothetical protein